MKPVISANTRLALATTYSVAIYNYLLFNTVVELWGGFQGGRNTGKTRTERGECMSRQWPKLGAPGARFWTAFKEQQLLQKNTKELGGPVILPLILPQLRGDVIDRVYD